MKGKRATSRFYFENKFIKMPKSKRSQVSVFIILAIVIVVGIGGYLYLKNSKSDCGANPLCKLGIKSETDIIKNSLYKCEIDTGRGALKTIGIQGGFYKRPAHFHEIDWAFIPYYYYAGEYFMPQKNIVESELSAYINDNIKTCISNLNFKNYNFDFVEPKTMSFITPKSVSFTIDILVNVRKGEQVTQIQLKDNPIVFNSSLYEALEVADYITRTHEENEKMFCINCVVSMAKDRNLYVDMMEYPGLEKTTLVMISENHTSTEPYIFEFMNKYA